MTMIYNDPVNSAESSVGSQIRTDYFHKKALVEAAKEAYQQLKSAIKKEKD